MRTTRTRFMKIRKKFLVNVKSFKFLGHRIGNKHTQITETTSTKLNMIKKPIKKKDMRKLLGFMYYIP
jgi:hypothetical protein